MATVAFEDATRIYAKTDQTAVNKLNLAVRDGEFLVHRRRIAPPSPKERFVFAVFTPSKEEGWRKVSRDDGVVEFALAEPVSLAVAAAFGCGGGQAAGARALGRCASLSPYRRHR